MLRISNKISIPDRELIFTAIHARGAGGQNVNKVASAAHLRFDINASEALPEECKQRLLAMNDRRISAEGIVVIKSQEYRSQARNKMAASARLRELIHTTLVTRKPRKATKPTRSSQRKRLDSKSRHGRLKKSRGRPDES